MKLRPFDTDRKHFPDGDALCRYVVACTGDTCILAFSAGKDAVGTWLQVRRHFKRVIPFYRYTFPALGFVERTLRYYEDFFGERIIRVPTPQLLWMLDVGALQSPATARLWDQQGLKRGLDFQDCVDHVRDRYAGQRPFIAVGHKAADTILRRMQFKNHGSISYEHRNFFPIFDWSEIRLREEIRAAKVWLPPDYAIWHRSFEAFRQQFMVELERHWPDDFRRILRWFPLAAADLMRHEYAKRLPP